MRHPGGSSAEHQPSSQGVAGNCCEETSENSENETEANSVADMESLSLSNLHKEDTTAQVDQTIRCRIRSNDIEPQSNTLEEIDSSVDLNNGANCCKSCLCKHCACGCDIALMSESFIQAQIKGWKIF